MGIKYPLIQGGMVWCSGWRLASAVSNAGGLGVIGAGSMTPELLGEHISKIKESTPYPFAVNLPLMYNSIHEQIDVLVKNKVPIVFTSAGNPELYTSKLKTEGIKVIHVVSSAKFAEKAWKAGVDAVVAEGFEAGGHNGREETTTLCLVPEVAKRIPIPVIAAGGIADGRSMLATMVLGAEGVQIGSRFVASIESSAHLAFKEAVVKAGEGDTKLTLKELAPVRLLNNTFYQSVLRAYSNNASVDQLKTLLGKGRARNGMFAGDLEEGELEIGQVSARIHEILPAEEIVKNIIEEYFALGSAKLGGYFSF
ncbi:MAG: hypothetical protein RL226_2296 [Bacteroidota bacterium]